MVGNAAATKIFHLKIFSFDTKQGSAVIRPLKHFYSSQNLTIFDWIATNWTYYTCLNSLHQITLTPAIMICCGVLGATKQNILNHQSGKYFCSRHLLQKYNEQYQHLQICIINIANISIAQHCCQARVHVYSMVWLMVVIIKIKIATIGSRTNISLPTTSGLIIIMYLPINLTLVLIIYIKMIAPQHQMMITCHSVARHFHFLHKPNSLSRGSDLDSWQMTIFLNSHVYLVDQGKCTV